MRAWTVAGGLIRRGDALLLVQNQRRGGSTDWSPPGGVIEVADGEELLDGLTREVREETGIEVRAWSAPLYHVVATAPDLGWELSAQVHLALDHEGSLAIDDPDGIVIDARFVPLVECRAHLAGNHPWVREPLGEWLSSPWEAGAARRYGYHLAGAEPASMRVTRLAP